MLKYFTYFSTSLVTAGEAITQSDFQFLYFSLTVSLFGLMIDYFLKVKNVLFAEYYGFVISISILK